MKNYTEYTAPDGYYYKSKDGNNFARAMILPLTVSIDDFELVEESVYQEYLKEEEKRMEDEMKQRESEMNGDIETSTEE